IIAWKTIRDFCKGSNRRVIACERGEESSLKTWNPNKHAIALAITKGGGNLARNVRKTRLPRFAQTGRGQGDVRKPRNYRASTYGCLRGRARHPLHPWPSGSGAVVD